MASLFRGCLLLDRADKWRFDTRPKSSVRSRYGVMAFRIHLAAI